jgi:hypothetical protein
MDTAPKMDTAARMDTAGRMDTEGRVDPRQVETASRMDTAGRMDTGHFGCMAKWIEEQDGYKWQNRYKGTGRMHGRTDARQDGYWA